MKIYYATYLTFVEISRDKLCMLTICHVLLVWGHEVVVVLILYLLARYITIFDKKPINLHILITMNITFSIQVYVTETTINIRALRNFKTEFVFKVNYLQNWSAEVLTFISKQNIMILTLFKIKRRYWLLALLRSAFIGFIFFSLRQDSVLIQFHARNGSASITGSSPRNPSPTNEIPKHLRPFLWWNTVNSPINKKNMHYFPTSTLI